MKKFYRFMSLKEFDDMLAGKVIIGKKSFPEYDTTSRGVCFTDDPQDITYLEGIVSSQICVEFEGDENRFTNSIGGYVCGDMHEYCVHSYDISWLKPLRYAPSTMPFDRGGSFSSFDETLRINAYFDAMEWGEVLDYPSVSFEWYAI